MRILLFCVVQLLVSAYAISRGGAPERIAGTAMLGAVALTYLVSNLWIPDFRAFQFGMFAVDCALLAVFVVMAAFANRYWPIWIAAVQLLAVAVHLVRALDPYIVANIYAWAIGQLAYPMCAMLAVGTARHRRRERLFGCEPGWS